MPTDLKAQAASPGFCRQKSGVPSTAESLDQRNTGHQETLLDG
jgi:hypothetical protein